MKKILLKIGMWIALVIFACSFNQLFAEECCNHVTECLCQNELQNSELTVLVSPENLYLDRGNIVLDLDGVSYAVQALTKINDQWLAVLINNADFCQRGHPNCGYCKLCHLEGCPYFVRYCKHWN